MLCGSPPFNGDTEKEIMTKVELGKYNFQSDEWRDVSEDAKNFICKMMCVNINNRYSSVQALNDPWLKFGSYDSKGSSVKTQSVLKNLQKFKVNLKLNIGTKRSSKCCLGIHCFIYGWKR